MNNAWRQRLIINGDREEYYMETEMNNSGDNKNIRRLGVS